MIPSSDRPKTERRAPVPEAPDWTVERHPCLQVLDGNYAGQVVRLSQKQRVRLGRAPECECRLDDPAISWEHAELTRREDQVWLSDLGSTNGTFLEGQPCGEHLLHPGEIFCLGQAIHIRYGLYTERELQLASHLYHNATRDGLTGLLNRSSFFQHLEQEMAMFKRTGCSFAILLLDLDHFKSVNDLYGHPAGDELLRRVAQVLRTDLRVEDLAGRYGGEEFCVLLRSLQLERASEVAERLRRAVCEIDYFIEKAGANYRPSVSIGVTCPRTAEELPELIDRADEALYAAKQHGRNQVVSVP